MKTPTPTLMTATPPSKLLLFLLTCCTASLQAQTGSASGSEDNEEVATLNPFEVRADLDSGYQATSTVSATALAIPLKESSSVVAVLTKEFLEDISVTTIDEAGSWAPNTYFLDAAEKGDEALTGFNSNAVMRGINAQSSFARNYFMSTVPVDPATLERIEQPRGPNAALFGAAPQVGMINVNPKKANFDRTSNQLGFRMDSIGSFRGTVDANVGWDKFAVRVNAMKEIAKGWRSGDHNNNQLLLLSGGLKVTSKTTLRAEILWDKREGSFPPPTLLENISRWDGTTVFTGPRTTNPPTATGTTRVSGNNNYLLFDSTNDYANILDWKGYGKTVGANLVAWPDQDLAAAYRPGLTNVPVLPSLDFNFNATNPPMSEKYTFLVGGSLEHIFFDKLATQLAYNYASSLLSS